MITIVDKIIFVKLYRIWFGDSVCSVNSTLTRYLRRKTPDVKARKKSVDEYTTVISDLTLAEEELLQKTRKKVRYEIKRADKELVNVSFFMAKDLLQNSQILDDFAEAYMAFSSRIEDASVRHAYNEKKIRSYIENDCIMISLGELDGAEVYHVYVYDGDNCCLIYSASDFRDDGVDKYLTGRINKYLHYRDMLFFKQIGVKRYDWGNLSSDKEFNGIDNFKLSFGGEIENGYNILTSGNLLGDCIVWIYEMKKRLIGR